MGIPVYPYLKRKLPRSLQPYLLAHRAYYWWMGGKVQAGPFRGLRYANSSVGSSYYNKLIGTYECELHGVVEGFRDLAPAKVIDVGAAEGYYAMGLARMFPRAEVVTFEGDELGRRLQRQMVRRNGLGDRVRREGFCGPDDLQREMENEGTILLILDCEGGEKELLDPDRIPALRRAHALVELHFFADPAMAERLTERMEDSHLVERIRSRDRTLEDYPAGCRGARSAAGLRRYLMQEGRREATEWLWLTPKPSSANAAA